MAEAVSEVDPGVDDCEGDCVLREGNEDVVC